MNAELLRRLYPGVLAKVLGLTRSLPDAEDVVQDAIERALVTWPRDGEPEHPEAWLVTVAGNRFRDRRRHAQRVERHRDAIAVLAEMSPWVRIAVGDPDIARGWKDELLALVFACCHPTLDDGESAALALATVIGLSTTEIAAAFVVPPRTMEQRLTRARQRLRERGNPDGVPPDQALDRLDAVLRSLYLLFNEGYWSTTDVPIRSDLCRLAIGLARSLQATYPDAGEVAGLLCVLQLHDARRAARLDEHGVPIPLPEQDRSRWDARAIDEAAALLERTLATSPAGPFLIEAAISALHSRAPTADATDWKQIAELYGLLEPLRPTPAVRVNRVFAISRARDPETALALLDRRDDRIDVGAYPYTHLVRGVLLAELERVDEAIAELSRAEQRARNPHEAAQIRSRIQRLENRNT
jgi:RNA polymerase sigma-70 factor, ECF subfamily